MKVNDLALSQDKILPLNQKRKDGTFTTKVYRELDLLGQLADSTYKGFIKEASLECQHPVQLAKNLGEGAAIGIGLTLLTHNPESLGLIGKAIVNYGGYAAVGIGSIDVYNKLEKPFANAWLGKANNLAKIDKIGEGF